MLSFEFGKRYPTVAAEIWNKVGQLRESTEFKRIERDFHAQQ